MKLNRIFLVFALVLASVATSWSSAGVMSVQVREGQLRATPSFLGAIVGPVTYEERVEVLQQQGDWMDVKSSKNLRGWIHQSALTEKQVSIKPGGQTQQAATSKEVALAGKGFNADVESRYRSSHARVDFTWVDRMEAMRVSREEMVKFLNDGAIKSPEGGAR
ncbi:MAG: SH3 domain-containing protein [Syntrophobacteraceae bacterium]